MKTNPLTAEAQRRREEEKAASAKVGRVAPRAPVYALESNGITPPCNHDVPPSPLPSTGRGIMGEGWANQWPEHVRLADPYLILSPAFSAPLRLCGLNKL